jgi:hypothetical protein
MTVIGGVRVKQPLFTVRRVVISLILAFALALLVWGVNSGRTITPPVFTNPAVEDTFPKPGDLDLRQARIGIDLKSGYSAELSIDGLPIPKDQVEVVVGLDQFFYQPGPGTATGALAPGQHIAKADITNVTDPTHPTSTYAWRFQVH